MTALGEQIVVMRDVTTCESGRHEVTIVTDGATAYAFGDVTDVGAIVRETGNVYQGRCGQPLAGFRGEEGDPCEAEVSWDLSSDSVWTSDRDAIRHLRDYGVTVERGDTLGDGE